MIKYTRTLLDFTGKHASNVLPVGIVVGILLPPLATALRPLLVPALFIPLTLSLVRIEPRQLHQHLKSWRLIAFLSLWILALRPVVAWGILNIISLPEPIAKATLFTAAAPPVTACAAIAIFLGIDAAIVVVLTIATMLLVPLSLPPVVYYLADLHIETEISLISLRLACIIFAAFLAAGIIKKWIGRVRLQQNKSTLDGVSVISIGIFIIGIMHGVTDIIVERPSYVLLILVVATLLLLGLYLFATLLFWRLGPRTALGIGLASGNGNMGLMYLILVDQANLDLLVFFAIGQIPMYFLPSLLGPLINRLCKK